MPNYDYKCSSCDQTFEEFYSISERNVPLLNPCPICGDADCVSLSPAAPGIGDAYRLGVTKVDSTFSKYVLGKIQNKNPLGNVERNTQIKREF